MCGVVVGTAISRSHDTRAVRMDAVESRAIADARGVVRTVLENADSAPSRP
jgi:hypothetical protein